MGGKETDEEIERAARVLVDKHGTEAAAQAALSAETTLAAGHFYIDQWARWRRIAAAIERQLAPLVDAEPVTRIPDGESARLQQAIRQITGCAPGRDPGRDPG